MNDYYLLKEFRKWYPVAREDGKTLIGSKTDNFSQFCTDCRLEVPFMYDRCPECGGLTEGYRDLVGETIPITVIKTNKFTFALTYQELTVIMKKVFLAGMERDVKIIVDSYGVTYTVIEFLAVLDTCWLQVLDTGLAKILNRSS